MQVNARVVWVGLERSPKKVQCSVMLPHLLLGQSSEKQQLSMIRLGLERLGVQSQRVANPASLVQFIGLLDQDGGWGSVHVPLDGIGPVKPANKRLAEAVRFELTEGVNPRRFSRPVP